MPTRVDFPTIVQDAVDGLGARCANEPARRHCAASLTGLLGAAKHTVRGSPGAWVVTTDPAGWTRWLPEVPWAVKALTDRRVAWWQGEPKTRHRPRGVMALAPDPGGPCGPADRSRGRVLGPCPRAVGQRP